MVGSAVTMDRCGAFRRHPMRSFYLFVTAATLRRKCDRAAQRVWFMCQTWRLEVTKFR